MIVRVRPEDIPAFFEKSADRLHRECYVLAEDGHNTQIRLSASAGGLPYVRVFNNGFLISSVSTDDDEALVEKVSAMYDIFLGKGWDAEDDEDASAAFEDLDAAYERDDALRLAFYDFLCTVVEDEELIYDGGYDEEIEAIMDEVLQKVSDLGLPVRRPTPIEEEDGMYTIIQYPYGKDD